MFYTQRHKCRGSSPLPIRWAAGYGEGFFYTNHIVVFIWMFALFSFLSIQTRAASPSKLSAHLINNYTAGSSNIVTGHPQLLKVLGLDSGFPTGMVQAMRDYKAQVPGGKLVVRIYSAKNYSLTDDPTASAGDFWTNILEKGLSYLSASDRALIDYLEGPNEGQTPTLGYPDTAPLQASQWFNQFWTNLTPLIVAAGYKPCIGSIAVGNPGGTTAQMQSYLAAFVPALRQSQAAGGAWSYHAYTLNYTTDLGTEIWYSLRYRQFYSYFASAFSDLSNLPLILTEGGVDQNGTPSTSGWQARGPAANYERWLNWFDQQIQQDSYVMGCTLFENGDATGWPSFDLEPIAGWLENYLIPPLNPPPAPTGLSALPGNGTITLSWTNAPLNPTTYNVKRGTNAAGPYYLLATNITMGVPATTYTDSSLSNSATYYYVVTAVNAAGESSNSAVVSASTIPPAAINCGGPTTGPFLADGYFDVGTAYSTPTSINTNGLVNPAPMPVYQSQRYGNVTYTLPYLAPHTSCKVRMHFAEIYWSSSGQRVFNVRLNGVQVLTNFDIVAAAGTSFQGIIREFNAISDNAGTVSLQLISVIDNASINGIELAINPTNGVPAAPTNLTATVGNALVTLAWSVSAGAGAFSVKRSASSGGPYSIIASNLTQATYRDPSFVPNTTYYYVVSALNALGESANSAQVSARPTNGLPDVIVTGVTWTPANIFNGSHAVFSARVLNQGSAPTPSGTTLGIGFNMDGAGTVSWSSTYSSGVAPGGAVTLTADGGPSGVNYWIATPGNHSLVATVDDVNRFPESIEDNNSFTIPVSVLVPSYAINCGGNAVGAFSADANFAGSANTYSVTNSIDTSGVTAAAPATVYQSERWGAFDYVLNQLVPGSNYTVRLHFAEISPSVNAPGDRRFNVNVNGNQALYDLDVLSAAGTKFRALTREIKQRADPTGTILVEFSLGSANQPECNGIEAFGSAPAPIPVVTATGNNNALVMTWPAASGALYQVQFKDDLGNAAWTNLGNNLLASGSTASITNAVLTPTRRFYRVMLLK